MRLQTDTNSLELKVLGYQFGHVCQDRFDSNWLVIEGTAGHLGRQWRFCDPCLLTWEVEALAKYLEAVADGNAPVRPMDFLEPNLEFSMVGPSTLRVTFKLEAEPPWFASASSDDEPFSLEFGVSQQQLREASASLRSQLTMFPARNATGGRNAV